MIVIQLMVSDAIIRVKQEFPICAIIVIWSNTISLNVNLV